MRFNVENLIIKFIKWHSPGKKLFAAERVQVLNDGSWFQTC